MDTTHERDG